MRRGCLAKAENVVVDDGEEARRGSVLSVARRLVGVERRVNDVLLLRGRRALLVGATLRFLLGVLAAFRLLLVALLDGSSSSLTTKENKKEPYEDSISGNTVWWCGMREMSRRLLQWIVNKKNGAAGFHV